MTSKSALQLKKYDKNQENDEKKMNKQQGPFKKKQFKMLTMLPAKLLQLIFLHEINAVREGLKTIALLIREKELLRKYHTICFCFF